MGVLGRIKTTLKAPAPAILMYHRVARPAVDPWNLAVSPAAFESQVEALKARRTVLPLAEFGARLADRTLPMDAVAITFDDGYLDNLTAALPILRRHGAPATVFVSTGFTGSRREFWWDELARLILDRAAPLPPAIDIAGETIDLPDADTGHMELWRRLQVLDPVAREAAMEHLRNVLGGRPADPADLPMTEGEIRRLVSDPLVTLGGHSVSHPRLPDLGDAERALEIRQGRDACAALAGKPVEVFAYPYGAFSEAARASVADAGLKVACTTEATVVRPGADPLALPRIAAMEETGASLLRRLKAAA